MDRLALIKKLAEKQNKAKAEEQSFQESIARLDARKAAIKATQKLTKVVKAAGRQAPSSLECFSEENMYYTDKQNQEYLDGSVYMETYHATRFSDGNSDY